MRNNPYNKNLKEHFPLFMLGPSSTTAFISNEEQKAMIEEAVQIPAPNTYRVGDVSFRMLRPPFLNPDITSNPIDIISMEMGQTEVTEELFISITEGWQQPVDGGESKMPIRYVTWFDCISFCNRLSALLGFDACYEIKDIKKERGNIVKAKVMWDESKNGFRLPTVFEWVAFARAGTKNKWSGCNSASDLKDYALYDSWSIPDPVGKRLPNEWGLYDMSGNVWEWCWDTYDPDHSPRHTAPMILKGGACNEGKHSLLNDRSYYAGAHTFKKLVGFRLARTIIERD